MGCGVWVWGVYSLAIMVCDLFSSPNGPLISVHLVEQLRSFTLIAKGLLQL